jgi:hypothetical protein
MIYINEDKYIVFKRDVFERTITGNTKVRYENIAIQDAVVIRRQDKFASPCLLTYAAMISMVAEEQSDKTRKEELQAIADYFHQQGVLAGEEGWKLPTP